MGASHDRIRILDLRRRLAPLASVHFLASVGSTNAYAERALRAGGVTRPTVFVAARQTAGRGRGGATWWSGRGCLTMTIALPPRQRLPPHELSIRTAVAVAEAVRLPALRLKWPNDLVCRAGRSGLKKVGGILCQRIAEGDVIGIGLNVNVATQRIPRPLRPRSTSLSVARGGATTDLTTLAGDVARSVIAALVGRNVSAFSQALDRYRSLDALLRRSIQVEVGGGRNIRGVAAGIDVHGRLILRTASELRSIASGHVTGW